MVHNKKHMWPPESFEASLFSSGTSASALPAFHQYNQHAGAHEREALRSLKFVVEMNGTDIQPGNGFEGHKHTEEACRVLWDNRGGLSYLQLWQLHEVLRRARQNLCAGIISRHDIRTKVVPHLRKAVDFRRLDMWVWDCAYKAVALYRASAEYSVDNNQPYQPGKKPTQRGKTIENIIASNARLAFSRGLTATASARIGTEAAWTARASFNVNNKDGKAARERARKYAEAAIKIAETAGPATPPMADGTLLMTSVWNTFCAQAHLDPAHLEMLDAMFSVLQDLEAEFAL